MVGSFLLCLSASLPLCLLLHLFSSASLGQSARRTPLPAHFSFHPFRLAETATAEVVRAVGAQGTIIGPTHAISAALTSLKGAAAARRARKTSLSPTLAESSKEGYGRDGVPRAATGAGGKVVSGVIGAESSGVGGNSRNGIGGTGSAAAAESGARLRDDGDSSGGIGSGSGDGATSALMDAVADAERLYGLDAGGRGSIFGEEIGRYRDMLNALMREAVSVSEFKVPPLYVLWRRAVCLSPYVGAHPET